MKTTRRALLLLAALVLTSWNTAAAQTATKLAWDENPASGVNGYSVTVDGVRVDYQLTPVGANGACGCSIPLPFSGGRHTVVVGAYNNFGETLSAPLIVGPSANAGGPYSGQAGTALAVNGSGSIDSTGTITTYDWNWGDGTSTRGSSSQASHTYASGGTFTITLTITDNGGATASATTTAAVSSAPPAQPPSAPSNPTPASGSTGVSTFPTLPTLTWSSVGATSYTVNFGTSSPPPQVATGVTNASYAPPSLLAGASYFWQIVARNAAGSTTGPVWSFTTANATPPSCPCSLWTLSTTPGPVRNNTFAVELGVRFTSDISGFVTGVRFYKYAQNTGTHVGNVWTSSGTLLGTVTFTGETASGWQQAAFATPIAITANTTYVVSYHTNTGYRAQTSGGLTAAVDRAPLHALSSSAAGGNGVYRYGTTSAFPNQTSNASNYWVDVVVTSSVASDTTPPTVTGRTPASGTTNVPTTTAVTATFSEAMAAATVSATNVQLSGSGNVLVPATVTFNAATRTVTLTPTVALANGSTYTAAVKASVTDLAGNPMTGDVTWPFTTAVALQPPTAPGSPSPANGATGTNTSATLTWSATGATGFDVRIGTSNPPPLVAAGVTTASYTPTALGAGATYFWQIIARNAAGTTTGPVWSFTTATTTTTTCPCSLWTLSTTPGPMEPETGSVELGVKFKSDINGRVTGVRFYKYAQNTGTHTGSLWTAGGTLLGTVTFTGETASGWQQATFPTPIAITANTTYVVSYHTNTGYYAWTVNGLTAAVDRAPLHALPNSTPGGNGVYLWATTSGFPNQTWSASNYWVDVVVTAP